jgi:hypothetical protein
MITGVRSALFCDKVERAPDGLTHYLGIHGSHMSVATQPGLLEVWLTLHLDVDKRRTQGEVQVRAAQLDLRVPFDMTTDRGMTVIAFPLLVAVQAPDVLTVTIADAGRRDKPFRFKWSLAPTPGARVLDAEAATAIVTGADQANRDMLAALVKPPVRH